MVHNKTQVRDFWEKVACGEDLYLANENAEGYALQAAKRYELEPYILDFADFPRWKGKRVLEVGVGLGADHQRFAEAGADLFGVDLTERAVRHTMQRLSLFGLQSSLEAGDAEQLEYPDDYFDLVYSWGVIHHSPNTEGAAAEIIRVLKPSGKFKVMIYNKYSMVGYMLWMRYALLSLRPRMSLDEIYAKYLESPGTKAYTPLEAKKLFPGAKQLNISVVLTHGDLLESFAGQRHEGVLLAMSRLVWPRKLIKRFFPKYGLFMLIQGKKPMRALSDNAAQQ